MSPGAKCKNKVTEPEEEDSDSEETDDGEQRDKILKAVNFPEVEKEPSPASSVVKVSKCIQKRLQKLAAHLETFEGIEKKDATQTAFLGTSSKKGRWQIKRPPQNIRFITCNSPALQG